MHRTTTVSSTRDDRRVDLGRLRRGFVCGVLATVAMSIPMVVGMLTGMAPMPRPIPIAVVGTALGGGLPQPAMMALGAISHLAFGGFWGAVLAQMVEPVTVGKGILLGIGLWLIMQVVFLPYIGWGLFGTAITPMIAVVTLVLHLIYGATLGWLLDRR